MLYSNFEHNLFTLFSVLDSLNPNQERTSLGPTLSQYRDYLKTRYEPQELTSSTQWPPLPVNNIFKLAMIRKEKIQRGRVDDEFIRLTITGKVDDILQKKTPVDLENIFSDCDRKRKIVLLEGAPGSGKSTLCLHICQEWAEGKLFQEYDIVVLVRLRDPLIGKAKTVADLLPCVNKAMADEAETAINAQFGAGVLWVLDGWDELPSDLPSDSIINKLIQPRMFQESPLVKSSVIIASRPSSSAELRPLVSSRVEVLGFTPHELEQFFRECLKGDSGAVQTLLERIRVNPVVEGSCYLPLNAAIVAHVFLCRDHSLPTTNHGIFTAVVQNILTRYFQERLGKTILVEDVTSPRTLPSKIRTSFSNLCQLAFYGIKNNKLTFAASDLTALSIPRDISKVGLLQNVTSTASDGRQSYFCFLHLSIQELLAAVHISHMSAKQQISVFQELFGHPRFSAVLQFYAGITKLRTNRPFFSLLPRFLRGQVPTSVYDLVRDMLKDSEHSKTLLVSLLHCLYEAEDPQLCLFVADLLGHNLDLGYTTLTPLDCLAVGYFSSVVTTTCTVSRCTVYLAHCSIGDQECKFLVRGLCKCLNAQSKITSQLSLYLCNNDIHEEGIHHIAQLLQNTSVVRVLALSGNSIGNSGLKRLCGALSTNTSIEQLHLNYCSINSGPLLGQLLSENTSLHYLSLGNKITDCRSIAAGLSKNRTLRELQMCFCGLTDKCVEDLSTGLNNYIQDLNIAYNDSITEDGLNVLVRRLTTLSEMRQLTIPSDLVSSITPVLNDVNEERRRNGLPEIKLNGGCNVLFVYQVVM